MILGKPLHSLASHQRGWEERSDSLRCLRTFANAADVVAGQQRSRTSFDETGMQVDTSYSSHKSVQDLPGVAGTAVDVEE